MHLPDRRRRGATVAIAGPLLAMLAGLLPPVATVHAADDYPPGYRGFHTHAEMIAGQVIQIRFEAPDGGASSVVEAGVDDVRVPRPAG